MIREQWLHNGVEALRPLFAEQGRELPEQVRVSVGWPGGRNKSKNTIGQCWNGIAATDGVAQIFISPVLDDAEQVLHVLAHELIHAAMDLGTGHKGEFVVWAKEIGLVRPWTATTPGEELAERLKGIAEELGEYPHAKLNTSVGGPPKQSTRMLKVECADGSGYIVRTTKKWLEEYGPPLCPCHEALMEVA